MSIANKYRAMPLPSFDGKVIMRPATWEGLKVGADAELTDYTVATYGYGTSSHPERNEPAAVIFAANESDIQKAVQYAYEANISLSVRSGGHQYGAFCSTSDNNITVDVSNLSSIEFLEDNGTFRVETGCKLDQLDKVLAGHKAFVPHGECSKVAVGGHLHTGGYSPCLARTFGFFCDHVVEFDIVLAPEKKGDKARKVRVSRPGDNRVGASPHNDDLWFSVIGGSPGNLGVVTQMNIEPRWDKDHADARAFAVVCLYSKKKFETFLQIVAEYGDDENLPADYAFNVIMLKGKGLGWRQAMKHPNLDRLMSKKHSEIYGPMGQAHPSMVALIVNWNNQKGKKQAFGAPDGEYCASKIFREVKQRVSKVVTAADEVATEFGKLTRFVGLLELDAQQGVSLSHLNTLVSFPERCSDNPYVGKHRFNFTTKLSSNGFVQETAKIMDDAVGTCNVQPTPQWGIMGGKHSALTAIDNSNRSALGSRCASLSCMWYLHYDLDEQQKAKKDAWSLLDQMERCWESASVGPEDRRFLAFCGEDSDLDAVHEHYFDSEDDYQRVLRTKLMVDPNHVFTPNLFCVGGSRRFGHQDSDGNKNAIDTFSDESTATHRSSWCNQFCKMALKLKLIPGSAPLISKEPLISTHP